MSRVVTANDVKVLSEEERKAKRTEKFGSDDKLALRAKRFGVASGDGKPTVSKSDQPGVDSERLKKRAERFGVVSDVVKKIDDDEKLNKRKQRFNTANNAGNSVSDDAKRRRMERFASKPLASNNVSKMLPKNETVDVTTTKSATTTAATNNGQSSEANKVS